MKTSTKYYRTQYSNICVNPHCPDGLSHWAGYGEPSGGKCSTCGQQLRRIRGEPRGTYHPPRR